MDTLHRCRSQTSCHCRSAPRTTHSPHPSPEVLRFHTNPNSGLVWGSSINVPDFRKLCFSHKANTFLFIKAAYWALLPFLLNSLLPLEKLDTEGDYWKVKSKVKLKYIFWALQRVQKRLLALAELRTQWWERGTGHGPQVSFFYNCSWCQTALWAAESGSVCNGSCLPSAECEWREDRCV